MSLLQAAADPNQISRENLSSGLSECLTAIPDFCGFSIPLLLEKLDSSLRLAKLDSLKLLVRNLIINPKTFLTYYGESQSMILVYPLCLDERLCRFPSERPSGSFVTHLDELEP